MPGSQAFPPVVGVDVGGTKLLAVRLDPDGEVVADPVGRPAPETARVWSRRWRPRCSAWPADERAGAVGVGVPGLVDAAGKVRFAPNLPGLAGCPSPMRWAPPSPVGRSGSATTPPPRAGASTAVGQPGVRTRC